MARFDRVINKWLKLFDLENYAVKCFVRNPKQIKGLRKDDSAMIDIALGEKKLELYLNRKDPRIWDERLIVHELTHVFLYRMWEFVDHLIQKGYKSRKAQEALKASYESLEEETVDRLTSLFLKIAQKAKRKASSHRKAVMPSRKAAA